MAIILLLKHIMCENTHSRFETVCLILVVVYRADVNTEVNKVPSSFRQVAAAPTCRFQTRDKRF